MPVTPRPASKYLAVARRLSDRLLAAIRPIRVLEAVRWGDAVERTFHANRARELPQITSDDYRPLAFDAAEKRRELAELEADVRNRLGRGDPLGRMLARRCRQAGDAVHLLTLRGKSAFARLSCELYGEPTPETDDCVESVFGELTSTAEPAIEDGKFDSASASEILAARLRGSLGPAGRFRVIVTDDITAHAAARGRTIRLRHDAEFSLADIASLEAHEGWVHIGTTLNARRQPAGRFLSAGLPSTTATQEGLAVLCELLSGVCHADRIRRLLRRYQAVRLAEKGADFLDVFHFFLEEVANPRDAYQQAKRVFRGSLPGTGPFAKDRTYALGLVSFLSAAHSALRNRRLDRLRLIFSGKVALADLPLIEALGEAGLLRKPTFLPPPFQDLAALATEIHHLPHPPHRLPPPHDREKSLRTPGNRRPGPLT
jgi:uncharacterized protein (TIGR02421 family)